MTLREKHHAVLKRKAHLYFINPLFHLSADREKENALNLQSQTQTQRGNSFPNEARAAGAMVLTLPYPISANRYWRTGVRGRYAVTYVSDEAKDYKSAVGRICSNAGLEPTAKAVAVTLTLYPKDKRVMDADNCAKVAVDALQGYVYINDSQVDELHVYKMKPDGNGARLEVSVKTIN